MLRRQVVNLYRHSLGVRKGKAIEWYVLALDEAIWDISGGMVEA